MKNQTLNFFHAGCLRSGAERMRRKLSAEFTLAVTVVGLLVALVGSARAQTSAPVQAVDPLMQLMILQPAFNISTNVTLRAEFDPPVIGVGQKSVYRVSIAAANDAIKWPEDVYAPLELGLKQTSRGQMMQALGGTLVPVTTINHQAIPSAAGVLRIPEFRVKVVGRSYAVPAAQLEVLASPVTTNKPMQRLMVELSETNAYCGQPITVRVLLPSSGGNAIQALMQVQINGDGLMIDQASVRQRIQPMEIEGRTGPTFIYEATATPLVAGRQEVSAQAYTAGNQFFGGITIQGQAVISGGTPQYVLLDSDPVRFEVEPLPRSGALPGFAGGIGQFKLISHRLETNQVRVGDTVKLLATFALFGEQRRLNPPEPPVVTNWQVFPAVADGGARAMVTGTSVVSTVTYAYTMIPLATGLRETPPIPFSFFDPARRQYVDLSLPSLPVTVLAGTASAEAQALAQAAAARTNEARLKLSELALHPGATVGSLTPAQMRSNFWFAQLVPLVAFSGLWWWERRRRFYERYPELLVRRRALRALRKERSVLRRLAKSNDGAAYARSAVQALRIASAPHFPATPRALVGGEILSLLPAAERDAAGGAVVRRLFHDLDAAQFGQGSELSTDWRGINADLEPILDRLEAKLR